MYCIKTGCLAYLDNYGEIVRGDLFCNNIPEEREVHLQVLMRVSQRNIPGDATNAFIVQIDHWFDEMTSPVSTLIGTMTQFDYNGL